MVFSPTLQVTERSQPTCFSIMAIVVGSPISADQFGSLDDLLPADQMQLRTRRRCAHRWNSGAEPYDTMPTVGVTVFLLYDYCEQKTGPSYCRWMADDIVASSHFGSRGVCSVVSDYHLPYLTTRSQLEHTEYTLFASVLPDIAHAHCRSVQVGKHPHHYMYSCGFLYFCSAAAFNRTEIGSVLWNTIQCVSLSYVI